MNIINVIIILIIFLSLFLFIYKLKKNYSETFDIRYKKCSKIPVSGIMKNIFNQHQIRPNNKWNLYIPCGYTNVENELENIKVSSKEQIIFGLSGCDKIVSKNNIWELLQNKYGRSFASTIMPQTYILEKDSDINLFKRNYHSQKKYILKKNVQRKEGILLTKDLNTILKAKYKGYKVVQEYLNDILLINNRKINLRIYVLIIAKNRKIKSYLHQQGKCIYTNKDYNPDKLDFESHITSYNLDLDIYKINPLTLEDLKSYFQHLKYDYNILFKKIKKIIYYTIQASKNQLGQLKSLKNNTCFQLFGVDIILDQQLNPYLLEFNKGPDMSPKNKTDRQIKTKVEEDMFNLVNIINTKDNQFIEIS